MSVALASPDISKSKVLLICMVDSIHSARWMEQFAEQDIEFHLFASGPNRRVHPKIRQLVLGTNNASYSLHWSANFGAALWLLDKIFGGVLRVFLLRRLMRAIRPDLVHAIELQGAGYLALRFSELYTPEWPSLMVTNWGSDIFWFHRFPRHKQKIQKLLAMADFYSAECNRDIDLALALGFKGKILPVLPNAGGLEVKATSTLQMLKCERKFIAVKGYDNWVGRARKALKALEQLSPELTGLKIVVFSANWRTACFAKRLALRTNLDITVHLKNALEHHEVRGILGQSLIYLGVSESDGISTTMLEAMAAGAIPVQTASACCDEWFSTTGVRISEISVEGIANAVRTGLLMSKNEENIRTNLKVIRDRASAEVVSKQAISSYLGVLESCH